MNDTPPPSESKGFGSSRTPGRVATEIALVVGGVAVGIAGIIWGAGVLAEALTGFVPVSVDKKLGEQAYAMPALGTKCKNPAPLAYVERLAAPLVAALGSRDFTFQFRVVDSEEINAFALPGGFVTVNIGLLENAESGEEVAAVLAHEMNHVVLRHGTRRILRKLGGASILYAIFGGTDLAAPALIAGELTSTAYDREQESEADELGTALLTRAGVDPTGMATFFARLAEGQFVTPPEILSTHPDPGARSERARALAAGAKVTVTLEVPKGLACD